MALQDRLKTALARIDKKPIELSRACGISRSSISEWMSGKTQQIRGENLLKTAEFLGVSAKWLQTGVGQMIPKAAERATTLDERSLELALRYMSFSDETKDRIDSMIELIKE